MFFLKDQVLKIKLFLYKVELEFRKIQMNINILCPISSHVDHYVVYVCYLPLCQS